MEVVLAELGAVIAVMAVSGYIFYKQGSLDRKGLIAALVAGVLTYYFGQIYAEREFAGIYSFVVMFSFMFIAEISTRIGRNKTHEKHETRTTENIIGNAGAAIIALALGNTIAYHGAVSAALADTMSSEIGMTSNKRPRLITNLKEVEKGTDGGITLLGLSAALIGALIIAITGAYWTQNVLFGFAVLVSGFAGSLVDSLLGAVFERRRMLNNMQVNFLASSSGAIIAWLIMNLFVII